MTVSRYPSGLTRNTVGSRRVFKDHCLLRNDVVTTEDHSFSTSSPCVVKRKIKKQVIHVFVSLLMILVFERKVGLLPVNKSVDTCCVTPIWKSRHFFFQKKFFAPAVTAYVLSYNMTSVSRSCAPRDCSFDRLAWSRLLDEIGSPVGNVRLLELVYGVGAMISLMQREIVSSKLTARTRESQWKHSCRNWRHRFPVLYWRQRSVPRIDDPWSTDRVTLVHHRSWTSKEIQ